MRREQKEKHTHNRIGLYKVQKVAGDEYKCSRKTNEKQTNKPANKKQQMQLQRTNIRRFFWKSFVCGMYETQFHIAV